MRADPADGLPGIGETGRYLGVRPDIDIPVDENRGVEPGAGGMSVVPPPMTNLAPHRLPREFGGRSRDPVFELDTDELPEGLTYRPDPDNPEGHGFVEPARRMPFEEFERAIHETRGLWRPVR
ncbi:MAG: hypothetical protein M3R38_05250 [Actinomycetota bacterium]|nr:hypothetical protein [Actinomycetota bacterium]